MPSVSEKTHAKNLENLTIANTIVAAVGVIFNPNNPLIAAAALTTFEQNFSNQMQSVNAVLPAEQTAVGEQIAAFKLVSGRVSKIMKAAKGLGLTPAFLGNLQTTANRLNGVRVSPKTPDNPETPEDESKSNKSVSRRSYAGILESLDLFDEQIKSNTDYNPNETEYKSAAITAWINGLKTLHNTQHQNRHTHRPQFAQRLRL